MAQLGHQEGSGDAAHPVPFFTSPNVLQKLRLISLAGHDAHAPSPPRTPQENLAHRTLRTEPAGTALL